MSDRPQWVCTRQRAGPLVKECRAIRPRLSANDTPYERTEKNKILRPPKDSSVCRTRVDRTERLLALFGHEGSMYTLTFDNEHLPKNVKEVRKAWRSMLRRMTMWKEQPFDYAYWIEGRHGAHRYHLHLILRDSDFSPAEVRFLWKFGSDVDDEPLLRHPRDTFRRLAKYLNKEAPDGITIPVGARMWGCSKTLSQKLPPLECWRSDSGFIDIPDNIRCSGTYTTVNEFGQYRYAWWIEEKPQPGWTEQELIDNEFLS